MIINWLPCCWSYGRNLVLKQFIQTHGNVYVRRWKWLLLSMFDSSFGSKHVYVWRGQLNVVYVWRCTSCARTRWLLSRGFVHEISLVDLIVFVGLVTTYYNVYVDVCSWLVRLCLTRSKCAWLRCLRRHHTTQWEYVFSRMRPYRSTLVVRCCL